MKRRTARASKLDGLRITVDGVGQGDIVRGGRSSGQTKGSLGPVDRTDYCADATAGSALVPARYVEDYPAVLVSVSEIDPQVVLAADRYFDVRAGGRLRIEVNDGRLHLAATRNAQDILLTDAFLMDTLPVHLATREFFFLARSQLARGGVVAVNVIGALEGPRSRLFRAVYKTVREVFPTVYVFPVDAAERPSTFALRNIIVIATEEPPLGADEIHSRALALSTRRIVTVDGFADAARSLYRTPIESADVPVLTDDFAPIDALAANR